MNTQVDSVLQFWWVKSPGDWVSSPGLRHPHLDLPRGAEAEDPLPFPQERDVNWKLKTEN